MLGLLSTIITARFLGTDGRGIYAFITTTTAFTLQFGNLGLHGSNIFYTGKYPKSFSKLFNNTLLLSLILGSFLGFLTNLYAHEYVIRYCKYPYLVQWSILLFVPVSLFNLLTQNLVLGRNDIFAFNFSEFINKTIVVILFVLIIISGTANAELFFLAYTLSTLISAIFLYTRTRKNNKSKIRFNKQIFKLSLRYGIKAYISSLFSYAVIRTSMIIVAKKMSMNSVGIYSVSFAIFDVIYLMVTVFATLIFPRLTTNNDKYFQKKLVYNNVIAVAIFLIFSFLFFLLFGEKLIFIAFGKQFLPAAKIFFYLMPGLFFLSINTIFMNYFAAQGLPRIVIYSPAVALCVLIISMNLLIEKYGLSAAGISFSLSSFTMFIISVIYLNKINFFKLYNDKKAI